VAVSEHEGELEQAIETTADLVGCPDCGAVAELHDRRPVWARDLPWAGRPVTLVWVKRVWRCPQRLCGKRTWTETSAAIGPRASLTQRARAEICRRVGEDGASVAAVAREFGVAALDPFRGYAWALRAALPQAVRVLDAFGPPRLRRGRPRAPADPAGADRTPRPP
jgi:transposase